MEFWGQKSDILLIQPPIQDFYLTRKRTVPYGLINIAAVLRAAGYSVSLFDALATPKSKPLPWPDEMAYLKPFYPRPDISPIGLFHQFHHFGYSYEHLGKIIERKKPFLVGISSLFTPYADQALKTCRIAKKHHPQCITVLGGHHPTALPEQVMQNSSVDFVIRGEGEEALLQLIRTLLNGADPSHIKGVVCRTLNGGLHVNEPAVNADFDLLPLPAHDLVKNSFYRRSKHAALTITASRGCPMSCSYCSVSRKSYLTYRRRSIEHVLTEIDQALTSGPIDFIDFEDENLTMNKRWFMTLLEGIQTRWKDGKVELRAMNGLYPPSLDAEIIAAMQKTGFKTLNLSLGSTSSAQLKRFKRTDVRAAFDQALYLAEKQGLDAVGYIIAAAPWQQPYESLDDLFYLAQRRVLAGVSIFYPAPGSHDYDLCQNLGLLPPSVRLMRSAAFPICHTTRRVEAATLLRLGRVVNFIKLLIDNNISLPPPSEAKTYLDVKTDRLEIGLQLLSWFFKDHLIRGVDQHGNVYHHLIDVPMVKNFNSALKDLKLRGAKAVYPS